MTFKKPYKFVSKYFRLLNFLLVGILMYVIYSVFNIYKILKTLTHSSTIIHDEINVFDYIHIETIVLLFISFILMITIYYSLLKHNKKNKWYLVGSILNLLTIAVILYSSYILNKVRVESLGYETINLAKELNLISIISMVILIIPLSFRMFNLGNEGYDYSDNILIENVNINNVKVDGSKVKLAGKSAENSARAYFSEHKLILTIIFAVIIVITLINVVSKKFLVNNIKSETTKVTVSDIVFNINDSYLTKNSYNGSTITKANETLLVVNSTLKNKSAKSKTFDKSVLSAKVNNKISHANTVYYDYLFDLGIGYTDQTIDGSSSSNYVFVFVINDEDINDTIYLNVLNDTLKVKPTKFESKKDVSNYELNDTVDFTKSVLGNMTFTMSEYEINNVFRVSYEHCYGTNCSNLNEYIYPLYTGNNILKHNSLINKNDSKVIHINNSNDLIKYFGVIKYTNSNSEDVIVKDIEILPSKKDKTYKYLNIKDDLTGATNIRLIFTIRDKQYIYKLG